MTVEATKTKQIYEGNGAATSFPVPFAYNKVDDIRLMFTDAHNIEWAVVSNFRVNVTESGDTSVTYPLVGEPIPMGTSLTLYRATPFTQIVDLIYGGAFNPDVLEKDVFDRIVMMIQELQGAISRAIKVPLSSDVNTDDLINSIYDEVHKAEAAAQSAQEALSKCQEALSKCIELVSLIPVPTIDDAGKMISVRLINGEARYVLVPQTGGSGGGYADYNIPANSADGKVVVNLAAIGHPEMPGQFNPLVNLVSVSPYYFCIVNRSPEEFTVQIYKPGGTPGVEVAAYIECGTFECGDGTQCGQEGAGSNVELLVSIPIPPVIKQP